MAKKTCSSRGLHKSLVSLRVVVLPRQHKKRYKRLLMAFTAPVLLPCRDPLSEMAMGYGLVTFLMAQCRGEAELTTCIVLFGICFLTTFLTSFVA